jgi:hypothetical protein
MRMYSSPVLPRGASGTEDEVVTAERHHDPLPDGVLDTLRQVSTSTLAIQLYRRGIRQPSLLGVRR